MSTATESEISPPVASVPGGPAEPPGEPPSWAPTTSRSEWHLNIWLLLLCLAVVTLAGTMSVHDAKEVRLPGLGSSLPELCYFRRGTGLDCPGCGLTRSFISLAHGRFLQACHYNVAGVLFFPVVAFQIPYRAAQLLRLQRGLRPFDLTSITPGMFIGLFVVMVVQWVAKLLSIW